ncbi:hypothetical protein BIFBRE_02801 [Bifidobacterium breve DSM 20213 = JCM 1192]|uniref:Uncharacterized protein n=1 Tax=Bifidobacterium breve DSM 20213 = JCM 1192 TaxID=518634 RepID=D4BL69_BIFBR|nr:hypothetical protein BIFBRE_02801 [Bifidobacterium breve DSM 20213 = JCM 1192]
MDASQDVPLRWLPEDEHVPTGRKLSRHASHIMDSMFFRNI